MRFIAKCRKRSDTKEELTATEPNEAEQLLILQAQCELDRQKLDKVESQLGHLQDSDGFIRCTGRLNESELNLETRNPILLPKGNDLTTLIVRQSHEKT